MVNSMDIVDMVGMADMVDMDGKVDMVVAADNKGVFQIDYLISHLKNHLETELLDKMSIVAL